MPILLATFCSTVAGIIVTSLYQRINLLNRTMLLTLGGLSLAVAAIIWGFSAMDKAQMNVVSTSVANILLMLIIVVFILAGMLCASSLISWRYLLASVCSALRAQWICSLAA